MISQAVGTTCGGVRVVARFEVSPRVAGQLPPVMNVPLVEAAGHDDAEDEQCLWGLLRL